MSRGYQRTGFAARESQQSAGFSAPDSTPLGRPAPKQAVDTAIDFISRNPSIKDAFEKFLEAVSRQQLESESKEYVSFGVTPIGKINPENKEKVKSNKLLISEFLKRLQPEVRNAIEIPKDRAANLLRGVRDRNITENERWKNGSFVYGFTDNQKIAKVYTDDKGVIITPSNDIESYGGAVDVQKVYNLVADYNKSVWDKLGVKGKWWKGFPAYDDDLKKSAKYKKDFDKAMAVYLEKRLRNPFTRSWGDEVLSNPFTTENEALLYDIKFKKTGDKFYSDR